MGTEDSEVREAQKAPVRHVARSDIGMRREENQDSYGVFVHGEVQAFVVADGMGGVRGGALASSLALETFERSFASIESPSPDSIIQSVQDANIQIHERGNREAGLTGMGTTFVGLIFIGGDLYCVNVGDSRAYRVREGVIEQLTEDHTLVMELLRSGTISADQVHNHPVSHMLTRSLGPSDYVDVDCWLCEDGPLPRDRYLLCSDGLYNLVNTEEIGAIVGSCLPERAVEELINLANQRGGTDNITIILIEVDADYSPPLRVQTFLQERSQSGLDTSAEGTLTDASEATPPLGYMSSDGETPDSQNIWLDLEYLEDNGLSDANGESPEDEISKEGDPSEDDKEKLSGEPQGSATTTEEADKRGAQEPEEKEAAQVGDEQAQGAASKDTRYEKGPSSAFTGATTERLERPGAQQTKAPTAPPRRRGVVAALLGSIPYLICASLGGVAAAVLLYAPDPPAPDLAHVVQNYSDASLPALPREHIMQPESTGESQGDGASGQGSHKPEDVAGHDETMVVDPLSMSVPIAEDQALSSEGKGGIESSPQPVVVEEKESIRTREAMLRERLSEIDEKLEAFSGPLSGHLGEILKNASSERDRLLESIEAVRKDIDIATRKLAVWYGRRKRLETTQPLELASEVSVSSETVQKKKEEFEAITWEYLKESEHLRYNPGDANQVRKVAELLKQRKAKLEEISGAVRGAIDTVIAESDQKITELTVERDNLEGKLQRIQSDVELVRAISSGDASRREAKKKEIIHERELTVAELEELLSESAGTDRYMEMGESGAAE